MGSCEIDKTAALGGWGQLIGPLAQMTGRPGMYGVENEWRQAELVNEMRLVTVAEIAYVFLMGEVGLREQHNPRGNVVHYIAQQFDYLVGLGQIDTGSVDLFPEVGNGVKADNRCTVGDISEQDIDHLQQNIRVGVIEIDLVIAEGGPDKALPTGSIYRS